MSKNHDYSDGPQNMKKVSPLLAVAAEIPLSNLALTKKSHLHKKNIHPRHFHWLMHLKI